MITEVSATVSLVNTRMGDHCLSGDGKTQSFQDHQMLAMRNTNEMRLI